MYLSYERINVLTLNNRTLSKSGNRLGRSHNAHCLALGTGTHTRAADLTFVLKICASTHGSILFVSCFMFRFLICRDRASYPAFFITTLFGLCRVFVFYCVGVLLRYNT